MTAFDRVASSGRAVQHARVELLRLGGAARKLIPTPRHAAQFGSDQMVLESGADRRRGRGLTSWAHAPGAGVETARDAS